MELKINQVIDPLGDGKSRIELIDSMGSDLSVVNDARASFDKASFELSEKDIKLIRYLVKHNHTSPLRGVTFKFKVKAPLYTCRQWWKHVVASNHNDEQLGWNEKSLRYVAIDHEGEFYMPKQFRKQSGNNKQGSGEPLSIGMDVVASGLYQTHCQDAFKRYLSLINDYGVAREQARGILPTCVYTSWVWTASLQSVLNFVDLRKGEGAQSEITQYAIAVDKLIQPIVPETMKAWKECDQ